MKTPVLLRNLCTYCLLLLTGWARAQQLPATSGTGLRGQYYDGPNFEKLALTRTDPTINFNWTIGPDGNHFVAPGPGVPGEYFSVRWTGHLYAPTTGSYSFQMTTDDGMRVWIGSQKVLDSWQDQRPSQYTARIALTAGRYYSVRVEYYQQRWGSRALLTWQPPAAQSGKSTPKQAANGEVEEVDFQPIPSRYLYTILPASAKPLPVPTSAAPTATKRGGSIGVVPGQRPAKPVPMRIQPPANVAEAVAASAVAATAPGVGLRATYFAGPDKGAGVLTRIEPAVNVFWQKQARPVPGVPAQGFSVRWTGYVLAPETGVYVFHTEFDDAHDVTFAGDNVLSMKSFDKEFFNVLPVPLDFAQRLTAGRWYKVSITYRQVEGASRAVFSWTPPRVSNRNPVVVPKQYLYPDLPLDEPVVAAAAPPVAAARRQPVTPQPAPTRPATPRPAVARPVAQAPRQPVPVRPSAPDTVLALPDFRALSRGAAVTLPNLYFTQSTASLLPASRPILNSLARTLRQQPSLRLEVAGHTDNVGDAALNLRLSEQRARVVRRYLVQQGIDSVRLVARGYGGTRPVADNRDVQQRPRNRRVEVVVQ